MQSNGLTDQLPLELKELWTRVTYAVAAGMIHEDMIDTAFQTACGVYETGWSEEGKGYSFQPPEAWDIDGRYRSLAYMHPLAIWAMQWASTQPKTPNQKPKPEAKPESLARQHAGYTRVTHLLKLPKERDSRSILPSIFDYACRKMTI